MLFIYDPPRFQDVFAIITRTYVETNPFFKKVKNKAENE